MPCQQNIKPLQQKTLILPDSEEMFSVPTKKLKIKPRVMEQFFNFNLKAIYYKIKALINNPKFYNYKQKATIYNLKGINYKQKASINELKAYHYNLKPSINKLKGINLKQKAIHQNLKAFLQYLKPYKPDSSDMRNDSADLQSVHTKQIK